MGTHRFWVAVAVFLLIAATVGGSDAHAGDADDTYAPVRQVPTTVPAGYVRPVAASPSLYEDGLRPGMVLRTWRVPATQPGLPAPQDEFTDFPPCPPAPPMGAHPNDPPPAPVEPQPMPVEPAPMPAEPPPDEVIEQVPTPLEIVEPPPPAPIVAQPTLARRANSYSGLPQLGGVCDPDCAQRRDDCCWPIDDCGVRYGRFELQLEGMFSVANTPQGLLGVLIPGANDQFDWDSLDYGLEIGARGTARYAVSPGKWLEGRFTWFGEGWDDASGPTVGRFGFSPGVGVPPTGVSTAAPGTLSSEAEAWSGEINFVGEFECSGCWRWNLIVGARAIQFDETASVNFPNGPIIGGGPAFVNSDVENRLIGGQVGIRADWDIGRSFTMSLGVKAIMGDLTRKASVTDTSIFVGGPHASSFEQTEIVFGTDIELGIRWRVTRCISITAGYNLLFLDNVLRANDAMDFTQSQSGAVQAKDDVDQLIIHSLFAGVNFNF